ncbi:MAG TPA: 2-oxoacid:acceptor oxidoreductase subunit alpha [Thermomicrobiales bacterium]|nr:2-oxoacid:acceptor oxidoreductase subunit alpha [Thermomicrobiales bacterium]
MAQHDFVIRIGGEAGEGVQSTGDLAVQIAARAGFRVLTHKVPPAEIKGGLYEYQVRLSNGPLYSQGDLLDILLAFNEEAYRAGVKVLKPAGLLIYDSAEYTPPDDCPIDRRVALPLTDIAKTQLKFALGKNVVAVGAVGELFGLPIEFGTQLLRERFGRKGEDIVQKNFAAFQAGIDYVKEHIPDYRQYQLERPTEHPDVIVITGSQALGLGALAAGCRHVFGYPITPASEVLEFMATELPKIGGVAVQAEDELAAIGMVVGAGYAGVKAFTPTSGPGLSLMSELLGLGLMAEIPLVLADIQRAGPSTGMPTRHEQGDLYLAAFGGHGEVPRIVLACASVADAFYQMINAFNLAERYQMPVIFLSDTSLASRSEAVARPDLGALEIVNRTTLTGAASGHNGHNGHGDFYAFQPEATGQGERYKRYDLAAPTGVNPMAVPGEAGGEYTATGLEHNEYGRVSYTVATHAAMTEKRFRKLAAAVEDAPEPYRYGDPDAAIGLLTWGSTTGTCTEAVDVLRARGIAVDLLAPKMLWPLPLHQLKPFIAGKQRVIVAEVNYQGQFADLLTMRLPGDYERLNTYGGVPFSVAQVCDYVAASAER